MRTIPDLYGMAAIREARCYTESMNRVTAKSRCAFSDGCSLSVSCKAAVLLLNEHRSIRSETLPGNVVTSCSRILYCW